jgi:hypothetical protein
MSEFNLKSLIRRTKTRVAELEHYRAVAFTVFIVILFGLVFFRISNLSSAEPSPDEVNSQVQAAQVPRIDPKLIRQLQLLQDNSVNVKTLFNPPRSNPF